MSSNDHAAEAADDRDSTDESRASADASAASDADAGANAGAAASADASADEDTPADPSVPEGFGEVPDDREGSRWGGYALAGLLALVFLLGFVRLISPSVSNLLVATVLTLFGLLVGLVAVWNRVRGS